MARLLEAGDLEGARARLPHLCARDPAGLDAGGLARATVESLAENTSDAVVAPLLWGAVGGVPALLAYRAVNTLDAMVGYRSPRYLRFGRVAARLDDLANYVPARVTGLLTVLAAPSVGGSSRSRGGCCAGTVPATRARTPAGPRPRPPARSASASVGRTCTPVTSSSDRGWGRGGGPPRRRTCGGPSGSGGWSVPGERWSRSGAR